MLALLTKMEIPFKMLSSKAIRTISQKETTQWKASEKLMGLSPKNSNTKKTVTLNKSPL